MAENGQAEEATKPASFSFALSTTTQRRVEVQGQQEVTLQRELITGISEAGVETQQRRTTLQKGALVIQKVEDTFQVGVGRKSNPARFLPQRDDGAGQAVEERFEVAAAEAAPAQEVQYGLNLSTRAQPRRRDAEAAAGAEPAQLNGHGAAANGQNGAAPGGSQRLSVTSREWELKTFRDDMGALPEEAQLDDYESMPIEEFGAAMLRGMGWEEGGGVGRSRKVVKAIEYVQRPGRLGLGAAPAPLEQKQKKYIKPGESREAKKDMVYLDAQGRQKHVKGIDEKLVARPVEGPYPGRKMRVLQGRHAGLACQVLALEPKAENRSDRVVVRLEPSHERATVRASELGEPWEKVDAGDSGRAGGSDSAKRKHDGDRDRERGGKRDKKERRRDQEQQGPSGRHAEPDRAPGGGRPAQGWLAQNIRVRLVDKKLRGGKLYLKKGTIVGVHQPTVCDVYVDEARETVSHVAQAQLETVIPKQEGARVLLVTGEWRGEIAKLLQRNANSQMAAVQLASDLSVQKVSFDDMAEYVGDAHEGE